MLRFIFVVLCFVIAAEAMLLAPHVCDRVPPGNKYVQGDIDVEPESSLGATGVLYGYYYDTTAQTSNLYAINPSTGATQPVCTIKSTYPLESSSQATITQDGLLLFTTQDPGTTNTKGYLVTINPKTCALSMIAVDGQQKQANFIKYDNTKGNLYMAFQNPFCIHSSLYQVDPTNGKLVRKLGNVVAGEDSADHIGMDVATQGFYYTYEDYTGFYLSRVDLKTGNITNAPLNFKPIGGGAQWIYNTFTLSYVPSPSTWGSGIVTGIANFNNASSPCHPLGVFGIVPGTTVSMICLQKLATAQTVTLATDEAPALGYLYQLVDGGTLLTYDAINKKTITSVSCAKCSLFTSLAYLSAAN